MANAGFSSPAVVFDAPSGALRRWSKPGGVTHVSCTVCGTRLGAEEGAYTVLGIATLLPGHKLRPTSHIQVAEAPSWYALPDDGLPRHERFPPHDTA